jgi:hypothetical protein
VQHDFSSAAALWDDFVLRVSLLAAAAVLVSLVTWVSGRRSLPRWSATEAALVGLLLMLGGLWVFKSQTLDRFWRIEVFAGELRVFSRQAEPLRWPVTAISDVRYGFHGKMLHGPCRLAIETRDGQRLLSADERLSLPDCQLLRQQVLGAMGR